MDLVNESVEHIKFGIGVIMEVKNDKIAIQFQDEIGIKLFQYPEVFGKFLKAVDPVAQDYAIKEYRKKWIELEHERMEKEHEVAELEEKKQN